MDKNELESKELKAEYHHYLLKQSWRGDFYRQVWLYPRINSRLKGKTLDIGCGTGSFLSYRKNTVGIDVNEFNVNYCKELGFEAYFVPEKWPFEENTFDSAIMDNVLEHISEPSEILRESHRVLKKDGYLMIGVPAPAGYNWDHDHKVFYSEKKLRETVETFGFKQIEHFHMPLKSKFLELRMKQYCYFSVFAKL
ncbi:MAG: class I SAM-dependent methyltransferase [Bacteriovoracaceae bacterium]|nr:class I SAM-dependent methyltransferase [Bacteriovoracaceae bacterium]